jgi:hypothetical protein
MTTNFDRYQRIAPFYDLLDLPFEYGRYHRIRPLLFEDLSCRLLRHRPQFPVLSARS